LRKSFIALDQSLGSCDNLLSHLIAALALAITFLGIAASLPYASSRAKPSQPESLLLRARARYNQTVGPDETIEESGWWLAYDDDMPES
jgi:hypothetical protein